MLQGEVWSAFLFLCVFHVFVLTVITYTYVTILLYAEGCLSMFVVFIRHLVIVNESHKFEDMRIQNRETQSIRHLLQTLFDSHYGTLGRPCPLQQCKGNNPCSDASCLCLFSSQRAQEETHKAARRLHMHPTLHALIPLYDILRGNSCGS